MPFLLLFLWYILIFWSQKCWFIELNQPFGSDTVRQLFVYNGFFLYWAINQRNVFNWCRYYLGFFLGEMKLLFFLHDVRKMQMTRCSEWKNRRPRFLFSKSNPCCLIHRILEYWATRKPMLRKTRILALYHVSYIYFFFLDELRKFTNTISK